MKLLKTFNKENVSDKESKTYRQRKAVRAIIFDANNNIALLHMTKNDYYEIPGGGVEDGETLEEAVIRESKEEVGCIISIQKEIGSTVEMRKQLQVVNQSFGYIAVVVGEKREVDLAPDEIDEGLTVMWTPLDEAIDLIASEQPPSLYGEYLKQRALTFLEEVKLIL